MTRCRDNNHGRFAVVRESLSEVPGLGHGCSRPTCCAALDLPDPVSAAQLTANGLAPTDPKESGIFTTLPPGAYTAILAGKNGGIGLGLVEVYNLH